VPGEPGHSRLAGTFRNLERRGDFAVRVAFHIVHHQRYPQRLRQCVDREGQLFPQIRIDVCLPHSNRLRLLDRRLPCAEPLDLSHAVECDAYRNPMNPGGKRRVAAKVPKPRKSPNERFLRQFPRQIGIPCQPEHESVDTRRMRIVQLPPSFGIAGEDAFDHHGLVQSAGCLKGYCDPFHWSPG
jgi:hypothetical protein